MNRLKRTETRDWMSSQHAQKKAILTNDLSMPHFVDVVAKIIGVWRLIAFYLKETGRKDDGDSLGVKFSSFDCLNTICSHISCVCGAWKKGMDSYFYLDPKLWKKFRLLHLLEICK